MNFHPVTPSEQAATSRPGLTLLERWWTWREHRKTGWLCYAYGGTMPDGRVRVCGKRRGHLDSHTYEWADIIGGRS